MKTIRILDEAYLDLQSGHIFYEKQATGLGSEVGWDPLKVRGGQECRGLAPQVPVPGGGEEK